MATLAGFDVDLTEATAVEVAPGVMGVELLGNPSYQAKPEGYDGRGQYLVIPAGVSAITLQVFGAMGGFTAGVPADDPLYAIAGPGLDIAPDTPVMHTRRFPVAAGQVLAWFAGGPPYGAFENSATRGNGPLWGLGGARSGIDTYLAGAGGGASALYLAGELIALSPGGAGAFWFESEGWGAPPTSYPGGAAGDESIDPAWSGGLGGIYGGGGGGAPYGERGQAGGGGLPPLDGTAGQNGAGVSIDHDSGGPPSPEWDETPIGDPANRAGAASAVRIFFFTPAGGWSIDDIPF